MAFEKNFAFELTQLKSKEGGKGNEGVKQQKKSKAKSKNKKKIIFAKFVKSSTCTAYIPVLCIQK